ncbi:hypothetical protein MSG28_011315 [Choristoneura fumiferana]|uniref:Uncharacterized protein n=1 Tax=Choristoneura fumiferana TaxID=7141 RepID=A0ACC0KQZ5_CHOFU|nr:hypothetical protein MSG28_011315 [Choristoneura fumiferana]
MAPRMLLISEEETVAEGGDVRLVCCAVGSPPPTYRLSLDGWIKGQIQKAVLLDTARIVRRFLTLRP